MTEVLRVGLSNAHEELRGAISSVTEALVNKTRILSYTEGESPIILSQYLYQGVWTEIAQGLRAMMIDSSEGGTRVLIEGEGVIPAHRHKNSEAIQVISGTLWENFNGVVYTAGETYSVVGAVEHSLRVKGLVLVTWVPPLPIFKGDVNLLDLSNFQLTEGI